MLSPVFVTVHHGTMTPAAAAVAPGPACSPSIGRWASTPQKQLGWRPSLHYYVVILLLLLLLVEIDNIVVPRPGLLSSAPGAYNSCLAGLSVLCSLCAAKTGTMGVAFIHKKPQYLARW